MLVGYSSSGRIGEKFRTLSSRLESFYPQPIGSLSRLTAQADLIMSARSMIDILGGNPMDGSLPTSVPKRLAGVIKQIALADPATEKKDAWAIREELGAIAADLFGPPQFIPILMRS
jgi:hypothetical protein